MAKMNFQMGASDTLPSRSTGVLPIECNSIGWNDSSWELAQGLEVIEHLSPDLWLHAGLAAPLSMTC